MADSIRLDGATATTNGSAQATENLRKQFQDAIAGTFYRQMMKSLRSMTGKTPYLHGGQAEEIFRGQLDELMTEQLANNSGHVFSDALFRQQFPHLQTRTTDNNDSSAAASAPASSDAKTNSTAAPGSEFSAQA